MSATLTAFHYTFIVIGGTSIISAVLFYFSPSK